MNTPWLLLALGLSSGALAALAQTTPGPATDAADASAYRVTERGPHSRVWSRVVWEPGPAGDLVRLVRTYTELQAGAHYWADGQWRESEERIESCPGGAQAVSGQHRVFFPNNLAGHSCTNTLDNRDPYQGTWRVYKNPNPIGNACVGELADSPEAAGYGTVFMENSFTDYVMFRPDDGDGNIFVPLGKCIWSVGGAATYPSLATDPNTVQGPTDIDGSLDWPVWTEVHINDIY